MPTSVLKILLLTHDAADPATHRRIAMLTAGGAAVTVAGFRRCAGTINAIDASPVTDWGQTRNGAFAQRIATVVRTVLLLRKHRHLFEDADIILARNLEMLALAVRGRRLAKNRPGIIYEVLDIHRLLLRKDIIGKALRVFEGWLSRRAAAVITSSPAFITNYFQTLSLVKLPIRLIENKLVDLGNNLPPTGVVMLPHSAPWIIGWFGVIRCRKSLLILCDLVQRSNGNVHVVIRGRPALDQIPDFHEIVGATPNIRFFGTYQNPQDLAIMYGTVHFTWAIDMYEEGLNSSWLLPNRLYEGCYYGAVPLAIADVETGSFLQRSGLGVSLTQPLNASLTEFFSTLDPGTYRSLAQKVKNAPKDTWLSTKDDCVALVRALSAYRNEVGFHDA